MKLESIIELIRHSSLEQPNVGQFIKGDIYDLNTLKDISYSVMALTEREHLQIEGFMHFRFYLFYVDRLTSSADNVECIHSHAIQVLNNVLNTIVNYDSIYVGGTRKFDTFRQRFADECAGAYVEFEIEVPMSMCEDPVTELIDYEKGYQDGFEKGTEGCFDYAYASGYTDGYSSGYTQGEIDGFPIGYQSGATDGYSSGYTSGYTDGIAAVPLESGTTSITQNGDYLIEPSSGYSGLSQYQVHVNVGDVEGFNQIFYKGNTKQSYNANVQIVSETSAMTDEGRIWTITYAEKLYNVTIANNNKAWPEMIRIGEGAKFILKTSNQGTVTYTQTVKKIILPDTMEYLQTEVFKNCTNLEEVYMGTNMNIIQGGVFNGCYKLNNINWPEKLAWIGDNAFRSCSFSSVTLPDAVVFVGVSSFAQNTALTEFTFSNSVNQILASVLSGCTNLETIKYNGTVAKWNTVTKNASWASGIPSGVTEVICTDGSVPI